VVICRADYRRSANLGRITIVFANGSWNTIEIERKPEPCRHALLPYAKETLDGGSDGVFASKQKKQGKPEQQIGHSILRTRFLRGPRIRLPPQYTGQSPKMRPENLFCSEIRTRVERRVSLSNSHMSAKSRNGAGFYEELPFRNQMRIGHGPEYHVFNT